MTRFMAAEADRTAPLHIMGHGFDGTVSFRPGTRFGPDAIRSASYGLETYDPLLNRDLEDYEICDHEDPELPMGDARRVLKLVEERCRRDLPDHARPVFLGGEHLLTLPTLRWVVDRHGADKLWVVQFDAHADMRDEYLGNPLSHATVMRHAAEQVGFDHVRQIGIRSGTREEWELMRRNKTLVDARIEALQQLRNTIGDDPVYITVDLDVLDPSVLPGTGTPEPGGISFSLLEELLHCFDGANIVAADVMELAPGLDTSGVSDVVAAKVVRSLLLMMAVR